MYFQHFEREIRRYARTEKQMILTSHGMHSLDSVGPVLLCVPLIWNGNTTGGATHGRRKDFFRRPESSEIWLYLLEAKRTAFFC